MKSTRTLVCIKKVKFHFFFDQFFLNYYPSGVYHYVFGTKQGNHAVKIIGWGTENGVPYWLIANSWGKTWGNLGGYFKIKRGTNECQIESQILAGILYPKNSGSLSLSHVQLNIILSLVFYFFKIGFIDNIF